MTDDEGMTDDERLSAYIDGELGRAEAELLGRRLAAEPALARRLEQMRAADLTAQRAFHAIDETPLPRRLLDVVEAGEGRGAERMSASNVVPLPARGARRFLQMPVAIAASVALAAGFLVHDLIAPDTVPVSAMPVSGRIAQESGLYRMLETKLSAEPVTLAGGTDGEVVLTFRAADGDWCRQFRLRADAAAMQGLACRQAGAWQMETASFRAPGPPDGSFQQAGGTSTALETAVRARLGDRQPLESQEEIQVISDGWETPQ